MNCALVSALFASCNTDELCYQHPHRGNVGVVFDWSADPTANPKGMRLLVHSEAVANPGIFDVAPTEDYIDVMDGAYNIMAFNNDSEWIKHIGDNCFDTHIATTRECDILEPMYGPGISSKGVRANEDERVVVSPDQLWGASVKDHLIHAGDVVTFHPQPYTCHYTFEFRNVGSVSYIAKLSASISGMASGVVMSDGQIMEEPVTIALNAEVDKKRDSGNSISGSFFTFGHHPNVTAPHRMALYVELTNGQKFKYTTDDCLDVTEQIHNAPDPRNVHIIITGLELPEPITNGGGFSPHVDDWQTEYIDIEM